MQKSNLKVAKGFGHAVVQWMNRKTDGRHFVWSRGTHAWSNFRETDFGDISAEGSGSILGGHSRQIIHNRATMIWSASVGDALATKSFGVSNSAKLSKEWIHGKYSIKELPSPFKVRLDPNLRLGTPQQMISLKNQIRSKSVKNSAS